MYMWYGKTVHQEAMISFISEVPDGGGVFGPTLNLSTNPGVSSNLDIAVSGNNVHVVWQDSTPGSNDIFYKRSTDGGAHFLIL